MITRPGARVERPKLSDAPTSLVFISKFKPADQARVTELIDTLVLMNEADVARMIHQQLDRVAATRKGPRRATALYVEREFAERSVFRSELRKGRDGKKRMRAIGKGPLAVSPLRGSMRVGSEGTGASIVGQAVARHRTNFKNHPGPDKIRAQHIGLIVIVTDFIGSGSRIATMLDKFVTLKSVRSWYALGWVKFAVVAAAATRQGIQVVEGHGCKPTVYPGVVAPALRTYPDPVAALAWEELTRRYGPRSARGAGPKGYRDGGALIVFSYRAPNNVPLFLTTRGPGWKPLFDGPIQDDMRPSFGLRPLTERMAHAGDSLDARLAEDLLVRDQQMALLLKSLRGRWRSGQELEIAERTGMTVPEVTETHESAVRGGLITPLGRLTDSGQKVARAGRSSERRVREVAIQSEPYYPLALRAPR